MTVYIDDMYRYSVGEFRGMRISHMIADGDDELHAVAALIGVKAEWFQGDHYDVPLPRAADCGHLVRSVAENPMTDANRDIGICYSIAHIMARTDGEHEAP